MRSAPQTAYGRTPPDGLTAMARPGTNPLTHSDSVCVSVRLPACLSVRLPACLPACLLACLFVCLPACLLVGQSGCLPGWLAAFLLPASVSRALCVGSTTSFGGSTTLLDAAVTALVWQRRRTGADPTAQWPPRGRWVGGGGGGGGGGVPG